MLMLLQLVVLTFIINLYSEQMLMGYIFGFELLPLNGLITFVGLLLVRKSRDGKILI